MKEIKQVFLEGASPTLKSILVACQNLLSIKIDALKCIIFKFVNILTVIYNNLFECKLFFQILHHWKNILREKAGSRSVITTTKPAITCSKLTRETPEQGVKCVQS